MKFQLIKLGYTFGAGLNRNGHLIVWGNTFIKLFDAQTEKLTMLNDNCTDPLQLTKNIFSTYHHFHNQVHGKEKDNTLFMYRKIDKPYHIDYIFASREIEKNNTNFEIGGN